MRLLKTLMITALAGLTAVPAIAEEKLKIGFLYPSPIADVGWSAELNAGRLAIEEHFGDKVETVFVENVSEGPDAARIMNQMAAQGADMIMLGSFGYMNDGIKLAQQRPELTFIHASGFKLAPNFGNFQSRNYESSYLVGLAAGDVTESNVIGIVAAYAIPEVIGMINGFALGVQKVNPDAQGTGQRTRPDRPADRRGLFALSGYAIGSDRGGRRGRLGHQHILRHEEICAELAARVADRRLVFVLHRQRTGDNGRDLRRQALLGRHG